MEELLLLGAGAVAVLVVAPIVRAAVNPELGKSISDSGRDLIKGGLKFGMETTEKLQSSFAEATESWNDLVAEAKSEVDTRKAAPQPPREVEIISES
ncbi:Genome sequencing data, contig C270 [Microcystis aeruginosa PCC 9806]|uniref:DUF5132 domain-containing protein n=2 Tax=Microcystis TaxID=1125 RepID=A0A552LXG0_9CHRO|nr:DUF5132 domain-containing protein [Microcystis aeruginosa]TRV24898.1 MAG: DUF5132 domain-containing protein [Microcystis flos-aquae Mf_WU_F_19750830_S460]CCI13617.1 Genome sequencing data, contig C270 [Microcystis aeruginosa PCC 9806]